MVPSETKYTSLHPQYPPSHFSSDVNEYDVDHHSFLTNPNQHSKAVQTDRWLGLHPMAQLTPSLSELVSSLSQRACIALRIEVTSLPGTPTDLNSRLYRTALALLDTLHRYLWGALAHYQKHVQRSKAHSLDILLIVVGYILMHTPFIHLFFSPRALGCNLSVAILSSSILAFTLDLPISHNLEIPLDPISLTEALPFFVCTNGQTDDVPAITLSAHWSPSLRNSAWQPYSHLIASLTSTPSSTAGSQPLPQTNRSPSRSYATTVGLNATARPKAESLSATWKGTSGSNTKNFIGGAFVDSKTSRWHDVLDPSTQTLLTRVSETTMEEFDQAVEVFSLASYQIRQNADALAHSIVLEQGKSLADARGDVLRGLQVVESAIGITSNIVGDKLEARKHSARACSTHKKFVSADF
ncbi:hypothetical protein DEU56DRAFT_919258 [Suillus clintonianus]|uniref:uncharacterized protein n=1 Tax=Suillus clintonianus TaxID=1904413 RepID=UPI001B868612|nr:uncharacterized protein DEU56DRAFT_919258 [Suillus clintonianus]KAG2116278.1 hypothetical protein DEU56DRAFT_919258 [Suillus clintonianus]